MDNAIVESESMTGRGVVTDKVSYRFYAHKNKNGGQWTLVIQISVIKLLINKEDEICSQTDITLYGVERKAIPARAQRMASEFARTLGLVPVPAPAVFGRSAVFKAAGIMLMALGSGIIGAITGKTPAEAAGIGVAVFAVFLFSAKAP